MIYQTKYSCLSKPLTNTSITVTNDGKTNYQQEHSTLWEYKNEETEKKYITLMTNALIFEYKQSQYEHFHSFFDDFEYMFKKFQDSFVIKEFTRLGLRYINEIEISGINPLNWDNYLSLDLAQAIKAGVTSNSRVARSMHQLHLIQDDIIVIFNYGLYNKKNYPNPVLIPAVVLDIDCYIPNKVPDEDILTSIQKLNLHAEKLFESSIGENLRKIMETLS